MLASLEEAVLSCVTDTASFQRLFKCGHFCSTGARGRIASSTIDGTSRHDFLGIKSMAAIPWNEFSKEELVELLDEFGKCQYVVEELWAEHNVHFVKDCTCAPTEQLLPARVLHIRDRVAARLAARGEKRVSPLRRLLQTPFQRRKLG